MIGECKMSKTNADILFSRKAQFFQLIWLVYLAYPLFMLLHEPVLQMCIGFGLLAVFVYFYLRSFWDDRLRVVNILLMQAIICYFTLHYDSGFWFMSFFLAPIMGKLRNKYEMMIAYAGMSGLLIAVVTYYFDEFNETSLVSFIPAVIIMFAMPFFIRAGMKSNELKTKLSIANEEIARLVKNEERQRISRDLHDTLGHTLSLIALKSELAEKLIHKKPERVAHEIKDIQTTARAALKQLRELVMEISSVSIGDEIRQTEQILSAASIKFTVQGDVNRLQIPPLTQNILGMCLREAVTNVIKHSGATSCIVELKDEPEQLTMTIRDDGSGAACENDDSAPKAQSSGRGLLGMKERLELIEGKLAFHSSQGQGTEVVITVPRIVKHQGSEGVSK